MASYYMYFETFCAVYELQSITKASRLLHISQPTTTQHIQVLESKLDNKLFKREGRGVKPTLFADELFVKVSPTIKSTEEVLQKVLSSTNIHQNPTIHIGAAPDYLEQFIIHKILHLLPNDFTFNLQVSNFRENLEKLEKFELDMMVHSVPLNKDEINTEVLFEQKLIFVGHPRWKDSVIFDNDKNADLTMLSELPWATYNESLPYINEYFQKTLALTLSPTSVINVNDDHTMLIAIKSGHCVGVMPHSLCVYALQNNELVLLHQPENYPTVPVLISATNKKLKNPTVSTVFDHLKENEYTVSEL